MFDETPAGPRAKQKEATRRAVLKAAREEFERVGFEAANVRSIAQRAGVSAGTVLHHYGDKRDLLHAALFDDLDRTLRKAVAEPEGETLDARLSGLTRSVFRYYQKRPQLSRTLLKESLFAEPPWAQRFSAQVAQVHAAIATWAVDAAKKGELRAEVDAALLGAAYFSFFYFALIAWAQGAHPAPVQMVEHLVAQHLAGLRPPPQLKPAPKKRSRS